MSIFFPSFYRSREVENYLNGDNATFGGIFSLSYKSRCPCGDGFSALFFSLPSRLQITLVTGANFFFPLGGGTINKEREKKVGDQVAHRRHHVPTYMRRSLLTSPH